MPDFVESLMQSLGLSGRTPETGMRPQDDETMRALIQVLRGGGGMGANQQYMQDLGVTPQGIIQSALRAPGYMPISTQPQISGMQRFNPLARQESGLKGTTSGSAPARIEVYPEEHADQGSMLNTYLHEILHAMRVNRGLNTQGKGFEEALAYHGTGAPAGAAFNSETIPLSRKPEVDRALLDLLGIR